MNIKIVKAPEKYSPQHANVLKVFLAGGISNCPNWQEEATKYLVKNADKFKKDIYLINPRRENFDVKDASAAEAQIRWEHEMLERTDVFLFWFPKDTLCPITLFELGNYIEKTDYNGEYKRFAIGVDPDYKRKDDVIIQTGLRRAIQVEQCFNCFLSKARQLLESL